MEGVDEPMADITFKDFSFVTATYDDFDGLFFTLTALRLYHPEFWNDCELVVVDNNPRGACGPENKKLVTQKLAKPDAKYIPLERPVGTSPAKQHAVEHATRKYCILADCHILFLPGAFDYLLKFFSENPESEHLLHGPLYSESGRVIQTHWGHQWRGSDLGVSMNDPRGHNRDNPPFEIAGCGMGTCAFRREIWPGYHPAFRGFGAEEIYIHEKVRRNGGLALCLPGFGWVHRFGRPRGVPYPLYLWHKVRNYVIAFKELGWDVNEVYEYFVKTGYMAPDVWELLIQDPFGQEDPPRPITIALDDKNYAKTLQQQIVTANTPQPSPTPQPVPAPRVQPLVPESERISLKITNDVLLERLPEQTRQVIAALAPEEREKRLNEIRDHIERSGNKEMIDYYNTGVKKGCNNCQQQKQGQSFRAEIVEKLRTISSFEELYQNLRMFPAEAPEFLNKIAEYARQSRYVVEISDDPFSTTIPIMYNLPDEGFLLSYYMDPKFVPELDLISKLFKDLNKTLKGSIIKPEDVKIEGDITFDLFVYQPVFYEADAVYDILTKIMPFVDGRVVILRAAKYKNYTPDKKLAILPGVTRYLNEGTNLKKWSVLEFDEMGVGALILSSRPEDRSKLPSKVEMAKTFAKALTKHIRTGMQEVSKQELECRLSKCSICPKRTENRCSVCGCFLVDAKAIGGKAYWKHEVCPLGYWGDCREEQQS